MGGLSSVQEILVILALKGGPEYEARLKAASAQTGLLGKAILKTSAEMNVANKRTWVHSQSLYTLRRYAFYGTLAISGLAYEVGKLGFTYLTTVQSAKVALKGMFPDQKELQGTIDKLYRLSTLSPFLFKDTLTAFRTMAPAMKNAGIPVSLTLQTMHSVMDALSQSGHSTVGNLTRVSVQLQHLANIGRPTGQVLIALARDGLPVYPALRKELHLTGGALEQVAGSGLTAKQVIQALNKFIETSPIYKGQAFKQATSTLQGNWQMFKDILSQAAGKTEGGLFAGLQSRLTAVNKALLPMFNNNKPIGMINIADAIDRSLTPHTHIIINMFVLLTTAIKTVVVELGALLWVITKLLYPLDYLGSLAGINRLAFKALGIVLGTVVALWALSATRTFLAATALDAVKIAVYGVTKAYETWTLISGGATGAKGIVGLIKNWKSWAFALTTVSRVPAWRAISGNMRYVQDFTNKGIFARLSRAIFGLVPALTAAASASWGFTLSLLTNPLFWIPVVIIGLAILYWRWKKFHDAVNTTVKWLWNHPLAAYFIPFIGQLVTMVKLLYEAYKLGVKIKNLAVHPVRSFQHAGGVSGIAGNAVGGGGFSWRTPFDILGIPTRLPHIPGTATGGNITRGGLTMVGERGPEMLNLPTGASVIPLGAGGGGFTIHVHPQDIFLDSKKLATVLATTITDKEARL